MYEPLYPRRGLVYIIRDLNNPNLFKIGLARCPFERLKQLDNTSCSSGLIIDTLWMCFDMYACEEAAHAVMSEHRCRSEREWFEVIPKSWTDEPEIYRTCYDQTTIYLHSHKENIEDAFNYCRLKYYEVDVYKYYRRYYLAGKRRFPDGISGF